MESKKWKFVTRWGGTGQLVTEVEAEGNVLKIEQYKQYIFKWGRQSAVVNINDISEIISKKKFSIPAILCIIVGLACIASGESYIWGGILLVFGALTIKTKYLSMTYRQGSVRIPDSDTFGKDMQNFMDYIRQYNPDCIKTIING